MIGNTESLNGFAQELEDLASRGIVSESFELQARELALEARVAAFNLRAAELGETGLELFLENQQRNNFATEVSSTVSVAASRGVVPNPNRSDPATALERRDDAR